MNGFGDGSGGRRNEEDTESDIMNKLEDSLDWHQQTTGFVSSYTLPLSHATCPDDDDDGDNNHVSSDLLQPIKLAKMLSLESNASSVGTDDDDGLQEISSIFRAPSPSVSPISSKGSPPRRGTRNSTTPPISSPCNANINIDDATDDEMMLLSTPEQHSIASESTEAVQNISLPTMKEGDAEITIDSSKNNSGVISPLGNGWSGSLSPHPTENDVHQQEGSHKQEVETDMANNETVAKPKANNKSNNSTKKWKPKQKRRPTPTKQPKIKKNNLVIQHTPARLLPPTHPLSQSPKHSIKSRTATKKSPTHNRRISEASEASSTCGSEAGLISMASEATPIISPAYPNTFSFSDDETSESNAVDNSDITQSIPLAISASGSTAELRGVDISFTLDCDDDYDEDEDEDDIEDVDVDGPQDVQMGDLLQESLPPPNMVRHVSAESTANDTAAAAAAAGTPTPLAQNLYKGDAFFDSTPTPADVGEVNDIEHRRQFSKDENFFDAVYNSGLQSTSFEQVADTNLNTSMDVEVEMVHNADGERRISENLAAASFTSDDGSCATEEEKRVMTKRIMQWRKGRELWRKSEGGNSNDESSKIVDNGEDVQDEDEYQQENEEYYDGVELAPLSSSSKKVKRVMNNIHNAGSYNENEQHVGELTSSQIGNSSSLGWRLRNPGLAIRNYIWRWNLQPSYSYDYAAPTQRASNGQQPVSSPQALFAATANDDNDDEDESESKALTPYKTPEHRRKQSMHYDDVDFERNDNCCSSICCCCWKCFDLDNYRYSDGSGDDASVASALYSDWKKLLMIAVSFFFLALLFTHGHLKKHHNTSYDYLYGGVENDPLARDNFINRMHAIEDGYDDNYWKDMLESPVDDDDDFHAELFMRHRQDPSQYVELEEDVPYENEGTAITPQHNSYSGIDTIVVLGLHELHPTFLEWMIDRLQKLYPDMRVMGEFPIIDEAGSSSTNPKERMMRLRTNRKTKVIDPTSNKVLGESDAYENGAAASLKSKSDHILVISVFINIYDWVEMLRVDAHDPEYIPIIGKNMPWKEYVDADLPYRGTILDRRAEDIRYAIQRAADRDDVKIVIPFKYEELVEPYSNFDNYVKTEEFLGDTASSLPGIVGLLDEIQARTGLRPDESAGWRVPNKTSNQFWADSVGCSGELCFPSINKMRHDAEYIKYINDFIDWSMEVLIGYHKKSVPKAQVEQIVVLGERHSGAEWLTDKLQLCFPKTTVNYGFQRPGKYFQSEPQYTGPIPQTLVISTYLNSFDWVELMRQNPIDAPTHKDLEWSDFVTSSWDRKRSNLDDALGLGGNTDNANCSYGFHFEEIIPCMTNRKPGSDKFPLYELHPSKALAGDPALAGEPYANLLELRTDKIQHFLNVAKYDGVAKSIHMRYEDLLWDESYTDDATYLTLPFPGIAGLLEKIRDETSLVPDVNAGWISDEEGVFKAEPLGVGATKLDPYYLEYMNEHVDWDIEMLVGYSPY